MADFRLTAAPVLGSDLKLDQNRITERSDLAIVSVAIPQGGEDALSKSAHFTLPEPKLSTLTGEMRAVRTAPDQMFLVFPHAGADANTVIKAKLGDAAYTTDQTDVWLALEVSGPDTLAALERICPIDLHPDVFPVNASARTVMEHMGAMIIRLGADQFLLLSASSSAASFVHAVETSYHYVMP